MLRKFLAWYWILIDSLDDYYIKVFLKTNFQRSEREKGNKRGIEMVKKIIEFILSTMVSRALLSIASMILALPLNRYFDAHTSKALKRLGWKQWKVLKDFSRSQRVFVKIELLIKRFQGNQLFVLIPYENPLIKKLAQLNPRNFLIPSPSRLSFREKF